jgi:hypothetical protein
MELSTEEKEIISFSWGGLFVVTGICSLVFSIVLKLADGEHSPLFIKMGLLSIGIALLRCIGRTLYNLLRKT